MTLTELDPGWDVGAVCAQTDPELFFPDERQRMGFALSKAAAVQIEQAKACCHVCPAFFACTLAGLDQQHGIWGGFSAADRHALGFGEDRPGDLEEVA